MKTLEAALVDEVEALCRVHVGRSAESEAWGKTCDRLDVLDKLVKKIRRKQKLRQALEL